MPQRTLREIAEFLGCVNVKGDTEVIITGIAGIKEAAKGQITFLDNPKYAVFLEETKASAVIISPKIDTSFSPVIITENPSLAFSKVVSLFAPVMRLPKKGIHPSAIIAKDVKLGQEVSIGPNVVINEGVSIGDRTVISPGVYIGYESSIGRDVLIYANVSIRERACIGNNVIIHSSSVIGCDGFGYETIQGQHHKIPQIGCVEIEDNVEIGSGVTIDRARFGKTIIGQGTKIDNLVQIAHNVKVGKNCIIVAQAGIAGSVEIGDNVVVAGQAGIAGHLKIGDRAIIGAQAGVTKDVEADIFVSGYPAKPHKQATKINAYIQRLPHLVEVVEGLKKRVERLEKG